MKKLILRKPVAVEKPKPEHHPGPCLNCGCYLDADTLFCPQCGQKRLEHEDMSFSHLIGESFLDYFHFDSKFFRTITPLIIKPGWLTIEYMKGRRKTFVEPFKLFLVISVIYFLLLPLGGEPSHEPQVSGKPAISGKAGHEANSSKQTYSIEGVTVNEPSRDSMRRQIDNIGMKAYVDRRFAKYSWPVKIWIRQVIKIMIYSGESFNSTLEHTASKMIFLLIPFFALLLKLFYRKSMQLYFEHLIFSLHLHSFFFLVFIATLLVEFMVNVSLVIIVTILLVYLFFALKRNYGESTGRTLRKLFMLTLVYCIIALPVFMLLLIFVAVFLV